MSEVVVDMEEFMDRVQEDTGLLLELFEIFLEDFGEKREQLGEAVSTGDMEKIRSVAHSLKGASGNISAKSLREVCLRIEEKGKAEDGEGLDAIFTDLDQAFDALSRRIEEIKQEIGE